MNVTAFFLGYLVGMGATVFAVSLGQAAKQGERVREIQRPDPDQLDMELADYAERTRWNVN